ncbi:MAG TPA: hypothetical protein VGN22_05810, partial [Pseudonocardia sp.]
DNLRTDGRTEQLWWFDFEEALRPDHRSPDLAFRIGADTRLVFGHNSEEDVRAQLAHIADLRVEILALTPAEQERSMLTARLDWIDAALAAEQLPERLTEDLRIARQEVARRNRGAGPPFRADGRPGRRPAPSAFPAEDVPELGALRLARTEQLLPLVRAGRVWVHGHRPWAGQLWEIAFRGGGDPVDSQPWTPELHDADPRHVHAALTAVAGERPGRGRADAPPAGDGSDLFHRRGPPDVSSERQGGAVAVLRATGEPLRLDDGEHLSVVGALERKRAVMWEIGPDAAPRRLVDPGAVWAGYAPRFYAVPELNDELPSRFAVVMFVATDPADPDRLAVFADAKVLERLPLLPAEWRRLLADRELARLEGVAEHEVQTMPLPPSSALLALVRPRLGYGVVTGPLTATGERALSRLFAAGLGRQPLSHRGGRVALNWNSWAPELARLRLQRMRTELISYTVVDVHGRTWTVRFRHTIAEIDQLVRQRMLPADYVAELDRYDDTGPRAGLQRAVLVGETTIARIRRHEQERSRDHGPAEGTRLLGLKSLLAQVAGNPGVSLDRLQETSLPVAREVARALMRQLADLGLVRAGVDGDTFGPVQQVLDLLAQVDRRDNETDPLVHRLLDAVAAVLSVRPALWAAQLPEALSPLADAPSWTPGEALGPLVRLFRERPELALHGNRPVTYLDVLHTIAASPSGVAAEGDAAALRALDAAGLVRLVGGQNYRLERAARRLLGDLAHPGEVDESGYRHELTGLKQLLERIPGADDGVAYEIAAATTRTSAAEGSPLNAGSGSSALVEPGPHSYGAVLLAIRDNPGVHGSALVDILDSGPMSVRRGMHKLARAGLVEVTSRDGGDSYLVARQVLRLLTALADPSRFDDEVRRALRDLAGVLMREGSERPSLQELARAVHGVRTLPGNPFGLPAQANELYTPPTVSYLDLLGAIRALPGAGTGEIALALETDARSLSRGRWLLDLAPRFVRVTRRVLQMNARGQLHLMPDDTSQAASVHPSRTKYLYELTPLAEAFLDVVGEPALVADERDRRALERAITLLRRNPGIDRFSMGELLDAVARILEPAPAAEIPLQSREMPLRGTLDAVAAAPGAVTVVDVAGMDDPVIRTRLVRFARWGLLTVVRTTGGHFAVAMPEDTRQLLHDLDHRATVRDRRHRDLLDRLDGWLGQAADLRKGRPAVRAIKELTLAVRRRMRESEVPAPPRSLRGTIDMVASAPNGLTTAELVEAFGGGATSAPYQRLRLLRQWGLIEWGPGLGDAPTHERRYTVPAGVRGLLAEFDGRVAVPDPAYREVIAELGRLLVEQTLPKTGSTAVSRIDALVSAVRATPGSPFARPGLRAPAKSLLRLLTLLGADGGLTLTEVAAAIPGADPSPLGKSIRMLLEWGLVLRDVGGRSKNYGLTDGARQLLADIDDPSVDRGAEYRAAVTTLGELLAKRWYLLPLTPSTIALEAAIDVVRAVPGSPLGAVTLQVPITSPRALLDALRAAPDGLTLTELSRAVSGTVAQGGKGLRTRLQALVNWQLVHEVHSERSEGRPGKAYRLTGQATRLLRQLDTPRPGDGADLQELGRLLLEPSHLQPAARQTTTLAAAIESVRAIRYGPLST